MEKDHKDRITDFRSLQFSLDATKAIDSSCEAEAAT